MKVIFTFLLNLYLLSLSAQTIKPEVISTSGGTISNGSNILTWTLGEPVTLNIQSPGNYLSQGFQQPDVYVITEKNKNASRFFDVSVFPNPSRNFLSVSVCSDEVMPVEIFITDFTGKKLFETKETIVAAPYSLKLDLQNYPSAVYFLKITNADENVSETFKIQKIR